MNDILPPRPPQQRRPLGAPVPPRAMQPPRPVMQAKRPMNPASQAPMRPVQPPPATTASPPRQSAGLPPIPPVELPKQKPPRKKRRARWIIAGIILFFVLLIGGGVVWYENSLSPVAPNDTSRVQVEIPSGASPSEIGQLLEEKKLIHSRYAFEIYTRLSSTRSLLQAGTYNLSPSETMKTIVDHITSGNVDKFSVTFLPGATLAENRTVLIKAGYGESEVDAALKKTYDSPLFTDKPKGTDLEGYIYGETYSFTSDATAESILKTTFDHYEKVIKENSFQEKFKSHGLNLYQGITLASIIQREVTGAKDRNQVAQVFYSRLAQDMPLGSDVTYQYAAKKLDVTPSPSLDSPYNTRKYPGLPPGPIATPGLSALQAVATPSPGDYLYFLSGDDEVTYFARTDAEHEANIQNHCHAKCLGP